MPAFICKQPNGKYCRFSTIVDTITHYNMTEDEYIDFCVKRAIEEARDVLKNHLRPFDNVKKKFMPKENLSYGVIIQISKLQNSQIF